LEQSNEKLKERLQICENEQQIELVKPNFDTVSLVTLLQKALERKILSEGHFMYKWLKNVLKNLVQTKARKDLDGMKRSPIER